MGTDPFLGEIGMVGFSFAPRNWAFCAGQVMSIAQNNALFALLGTIYGGDGQTTFKLPDLRGRAPIGMGTGPGLSPYEQGQIGGVENLTLTTNNMPVHNHGAVFTSSGGGSAVTLYASNKQATESVPGTSGANTLAAPYYADGPAPVAGYVNDSAPTVPITGISGGGSAGGSVTVANSGGSLPFSILQPYIAVNYLIALQGIFPNRN